MKELPTRVLAPNPGWMTGRGTNSYLLGQEEVVVIDPGPLIPEHLEALRIASQPLGRLAVALVTHWHPDHLPAALELRRRFGVRLAGHRSLPCVDLPLEDGSSLALGGLELRAVATPGHTADHLCFLEPARGWLFSGDHVAGAGTVVIAPPDGDMASYLASLRKVQTLRPRLLLPGHGPVVERPEEKLAEYLEHRLERERQITTRLREGPRTVGELVAAIYVDVPNALLPVAARSVLAHLLKLRDEGVAWQVGEHWELIEH